MTVIACTHPHIGQRIHPFGRVSCADCGADLPLEGDVSGAKGCPRGDPGVKGPPADAVNRPAHYGGADNPYEAIKIIEDWGLDFCLGNAVKYISRAGKKGSALEDLRKAKWYLNRANESDPLGDVHADEETNEDYAPSSVIEAWDLNFNLGSVIVGIAAHELDGALKHLSREIDRREKAEQRERNKNAEVVHDNLGPGGSH